MFKYLSKLLILIVLTLSCLIVIKSNKEIKNNIYDYVYNYNISFSSINKQYKKYFGNNILFDNYIKPNTKQVFNDKLEYTKKEKYLDGVNLSVTNDYLVPALESGLVIFAGNKEGYGQVVIVEQIDGINVWYGNLDNVNIKLYDYLEKGSLIGNCHNNLYLVYKKDGKVLNYEDNI